MSIGYETQIPPINTLAFYNAIANNGVMVKPRFVKSIVKDGQVVEDIAPEILNPAIASPKAISEIQTILEKVVSEGLGKKAGSKQFHVSGKTGTAQVSQGKAGYTNGTRRYLVSFCGYFPSEAPKYSCIFIPTDNYCLTVFRLGTEDNQNIIKICLSLCERINSFNM